MIKNNHCDTIFEAEFFNFINNIAEYITAKGTGFKELNIKYDDNKNDDTVIMLDSNKLDGLYRDIDLCVDIIEGLYYNPKDNFYIKKNK